MKIHPSPNRRNITVRYTGAGQNKLRRLPHIFGKVLELPFYSDADVSIHETSDSLRFVVDTADDIGTDIAARTIEICPGVTKVVVSVGEFSGGGGDEMRVDLWRFRLPEATKPERATAAVSGGELVVVVPKDVDQVWGGRLVLVQ